GFRWWQEGALLDAANFALQQGRADDAEPWVRDALEIALALDDGQGLAYGFASLAWVAAAHGDDRRAGFLWGATESVVASGRPLGGWPGDRDEFAAAVIRETPTFEEGRGEGTRMPLEQAVRAAMRRPD